MKNLFQLAEVNIPVLVANHAHRIGRVYKGCTSNNKSKGIIVRCTTFRHRTMLYQPRSELKRVKVRKLDLV